MNLNNPFHQSAPITANFPAFVFHQRSFHSRVLTACHQVTQRVQIIREKMSRVEEDVATRTWTQMQDRNMEVEWTEDNLLVVIVKAGCRVSEAWPGIKPRLLQWGRGIQPLSQWGCTQAAGHTRSEHIFWGKQQAEDEMQWSCKHRETYRVKINKRNKTYHTQS